MTVGSLAARPRPFDLAIAETAVVVNDVQNAFVSPGGYLDCAGFDIGGAARVVERIGRVLDAARAARMPVVYSQNGFDQNLDDVAAGSPWRAKSPALELMRWRPELDGTILIKGTWDYAIVEALAPRPGDIVVPKTRPSCFAGTTLDMMLRARGIRTIALCGIASNVGVEWTLRDGLSLEYFGIMIEDATMPAGPSFVHDAAVFNVEHFVGWVTTTEDFCRALAGDARSV
jgi:ureidoacrylate peracid hydrolase